MHAVCVEEPPCVNTGSTLEYIAMAFSDPQSVTISADAKSLPRVGSGENKGVFRKDDDSYEMTVTHQYGKRTRRAIQLTSNKIVEDPLISTVNVPVSASVTLVVNEPTVGFTNTELKAVLDGFMTYLTASSGAKLTQLLGGES